MYFLNKNTDSHPQFSIMEINNNNNVYSLNEKFNFELDSPGEFNTNPLLNDMIKINDKRFSFIYSSNDKLNLYIILFDFYNNDRSIKERIYKINLYHLYSYKIYNEL